MTDIAIAEKAVNQTTIYGDHNIVLQNVGAGATINIDASESPTYSPRSAPVLQLPAAFPALQGRQQELADLRSDCESVGARVSLWAPRGMGKTSLVRHLTELVDRSKSIVYVDASKTGKEDLLRVLFQAFYESKPPTYEPSPNLIPNTLRDLEALVFVDNLSLSGSGGSTDGVSWSNDDVQSLSNAAPKCTFVLISEKRALPGEGKVLELEGLPEGDAVALYENTFKEIAKRPLNDTEKASCHEICSLLNGYPSDIIQVAGCGEALFDVLSQLGGGKVNDELIATLVTSNLTEAELELLLFLASAGDQPVPTGLIAKAKLKFRSLDIPAELERFKNLGLIQSHSPRYSLCGRLSSGLAAARDLSPWRDALLESSTAWLAEQDASEDVKGSLGMMLYVLSDAASREKWSQVIQLGRLLDKFVVYYHRWQAWATVLNLVFKAAQSTLDSATEGWALHQMGSRALAQGELEPARSYLNQALKIREALHDREGVELTRHNLDVLKQVVAQSRGNGSSHGGSGGSRPLTYGFFGFAGLALVIAAAWLFSQRSPSAPATTEPAVPPVVITTSAPITPSSTTTLTLTPTLTETPSSTPTETETPPPTDTPTPQVPFPAVVIPDQLNCHYGPGKPYAYAWGLYAGDVVEVIGRADTAFGPWVYVKPMPKFGKGPNLPCWVNAGSLKMDGDISMLEQYYPDKAPLILFTDPKYVPSRFPPPTAVDPSRTGNLVQVSFTGKDLAPGDRQGPGYPLFLVEFWSCQNGQIVFTPIGVYVDYDPKQPIVTGFAEVQDDAGCSEPSSGRIYLAHSDGYVGPADIPWP